MFCREVEDALRFVNQDLCKQYKAGTSFFMRETQKGGEACLKIISSFPCIHVRDVDKHGYPLLEDKMCADHLILKYRAEEGVWDIHIFEMKRKISYQTWYKHVVPQFKGGLLNAFALCGVLHIEMEQIHRVYVHCVYREDKTNYSLAERKVPLGQSAKEVDWLHQPLKMDCFPQKEMINIPIQVDLKDGTGTYQLFE